MSDTAWLGVPRLAASKTLGKPQSSGVRRSTVTLATQTTTRCSQQSIVQLLQFTALQVSTTQLLNYSALESASLTIVQLLSSLVNGATNAVYGTPGIKRASQSVSQCSHQIIWSHRQELIQ